MSKTRLHIISILVGISLVLPCAGITPETPEELKTSEELETWFYDDSDIDTESINEGELVFISPENPESILHSKNQITVTADSMKTGWVGLRQCYANLVPVKESQITYQYRHMRELKIVSISHIEKAWIEGESVQMHNVQNNAELCITAQVRIFYQNPDRSFTLVSGPYHLKFLDGYYPLHVSFTVTYPGDRLRFTGIEPKHPLDMQPMLAPGKLSIDTFFEGRLIIKINFQAIE